MTPSPGGPLSDFSPIVVASVTEAIRPDSDRTEVKGDHGWISLSLRSKFVSIMAATDGDLNSTEFQSQFDRNLAAIKRHRSPLGFRDWL